MGLNSGATLTEDEAELYDRQIRLWGVESQKRIREAKVLIIGLRGFGAEVAKNIILSGVKAVTFLDHCDVTEDDIASQFLAPKDQVGKNRAEASLERAQRLNPMVQVTADKDKVEDKPDEFFHPFHVICASECPTTQLIRINLICREKDIKFFCGDVFGFVGFTFADLQIHHYIEEIKKPSKTETITETVKHKQTFVPLCDALEVNWQAPSNKQRLKKMDPTYFVIKVLLKFRDTKGRDPNPALREDDLENLIKMKEDMLQQINVPSDIVPEELMRNVFSEVSPVCAIVGGVMAQEIIKAVSRKEAPHNNMFFFNPVTSLGTVELMGADV